MDGAERVGMRSRVVERRDREGVDLRVCRVVMGIVLCLVEVLVVDAVVGWKRRLMGSTWY